MRALVIAGALVTTASVVLAGCSHEKKSREERGVTVDERGAGGPGGRTDTGGAPAGTTGFETEKVGHLEGTIQQVEQDKFLVAIQPEKVMGGEMGPEGREGSNLIFVSLDGAELYDEGGNKLDTTNREKLFGESGQLKPGKKISVDYSGIEKSEGVAGAAGEPRLVHRARRVNLLRSGS